MAGLSFDPYAVLGVSRNATTLQVARAHRRLAKRHHPDIHRTPEATVRMRRINEAWQLLSNPVRRADYDRAHPAAGTDARGHWAASRQTVRPSAPSSTRSWATWRASAAETRAAPRTRRAAGEQVVPRTRRPPRPEPMDAGFLASGWAAAIVGAIVVLLVILAAFAGNVTNPQPLP